MPTTIRTEQARVALARREYENDSAEHKRQLNARAQELKRDPRAVDLASFQKLCIADPEFCELVLLLESDAVWRDSVIRDGDIPSIEDDGSIRWTAPQHAGKPN